MSLYRLCISSEQHPCPRPAGGWLGQVGADGARNSMPPGSSLVSLPSLSRTPQPRPCPLPPCQCCGLLILTYSSPTCQDERQEMGSSSSHSRSGQTTLHHISRPVMGSWRQTRRGLTSGTALTGRQTPRMEPLLTTDCRQPCSLPLLPVAEATFSEGHSHWGSPLP